MTPPERRRLISGPDAHADEPGPFVAQEHGGMHVVNVDQEYEEVTALSLADQDPAFAQIVLVEGSDASIPLKEPGPTRGPFGARLKGDEAFGSRFLGEFEIIVTRSGMTERAERPFIEFSCDADLCPDYVL